MYDTFFIHAGLPKTGSSHLQDSLHALSRAGLLSRVAYPDATPHLGTGNCSALARELIFTNPAPTPTPRLESLVDDILQASRGGAGSLLISSEDLCYADPEKFSRLRQVLLGHARSVKLVLAIRPLKAWSYSVYLQLVRAHGLAADFDGDWLRGHTRDFLYYFRNLDRFGVDTLCFRYRDRDLLPGFLALVGEEPALASQVPATVANRSLSVEELGVVRAINAVFADEVLGRKVGDALVAQGPARPGARFPADREAQYRRFAADFARELDAFPGPVMDAARAILFDDPEPVPMPPVAPAADAPGPAVLAAAEVDIALRALRAHFQAGADELSRHRALIEYTSGLERTAAGFDPVHYLLMHPDVLQAGIDPWQHFQRHGRDEGRAASFKPRDPG